VSNLLHVTILEPKILKVAPSFLERVWKSLLKGRVLDLAFPPEDGVETSIPGNSADLVASDDGLPRNATLLLLVHLYQNCLNYSDTNMRLLQQYKTLNYCFC
jgi:hypothetical protein